MASPQSLTSLQAAAVESLRRYLTGPEAERTERLRETASVVVDARQHFYTKEGEPDLVGRTYAYRRWVRELMTLANVPAADIASVQSAVRYHTSNVMRERYDADTLTSLGLRPESARERSAEKRDRYSETLAVFGSGGREITEPAEIVSVLGTIEAVLRRITIPRASAKNLAAVQRAAEAVCATANALVERP